MALTFDGFRQYRVTSTIDVLFSASFLELVKAESVSLRSISTFSEQSELSLSLDFKGNLQMTMSKRLYESSGLDAAQVIVDSVHFSSTARLLSFNLVKLSNEAGHLKRIRERCERLAKPLFSCEFVVLCKGRLGSIFDSPVVEQPLPNFQSYRLETRAWFDKEDASLQEKLEWMSLAVRTTLDGERSDFSGLSILKLEGPLLPSCLITQIIDCILPQASHLIVAAKVPYRIPPHPHLNKLRAAHFNPRKFDPTVATADQQGFFIVKSPSEASVYTLNTTA